MTSIKEIAKKLGISPSTVSFVLNGKEKERRISESLAKEVRKVARQSGYQRNQVAVSLRTGKSKIIALIVDTISGSFFSSLARTIEQEAQASGYRVIYGSTGTNAKGEDVIQILHQYHVDGFLIIPWKGMEKDIKSLLLRKKPLVLLDSYFPGVQASHVLVDNYEGMMKGAEYLIDKGYKKIGLVCNDIEMVQMHERKGAFVDTLKKRKLPFKKQLVCETKYESAQEDVIQQIETFIKTTKPEAIMFAANYLGVCGLEAIKNLNLKIPSDIAVVCFDDLDIFNLYPPGITSIRQPIKEIAKTAFHILMDEMDQKTKKKKQQVQLKPEIIERYSA